MPSIRTLKPQLGTLSLDPYSLALGPATQLKSPSEVFQNNFSAKTNSVLLDLSALSEIIFFSLLTLGLCWSQILRICFF